MAAILPSIFPGILHAPPSMSVGQCLAPFSQEDSVTEDGLQPVPSFSPPDPLPPQPADPPVGVGSPDEGPRPTVGLFVQEEISSIISCGPSTLLGSCETSGPPMEDEKRAANPLSTARPGVQAARGGDGGETGTRLLCLDVLCSLHAARVVEASLFVSRQILRQ